MEDFQLKGQSTARNILLLLACVALLWSPISKVQGQDYSALERVVTLAIEKNPRIRIADLDIQSQKGFAQQALGTFNPFLSFGLSQSSDLFPNTKAIREGLYVGTTPDPDFENFLLNYNLSVSKRFTNGLLLSPSLSLSNFGKDFNYQALDDAGLGKFITNRGSLYISATQPLLKGRGARYYRATLDVQRLNLNATQLSYINTSSLQILGVISAYLNYLSAWNALEIQKSVLENYKTFAIQLNELAEKDVIPKAELLFINANMTSQAALVAQAEGRYIAARNTMVELTGSGIDELDIASPVDTSFFVDNLVEPDSLTYVSFWMKKSLENRGDYLSAVKRIESNQVSLNFARNDNLPQLDLNVSVGYNGIYESNTFEQYFAPFYSNIPGMSYLAGVNFTLPLGRDATKGALKAAMANKETAEMFKTQIELNIKQNVSTTFNQILAFNKAVEESKQAVGYNKQSIDNEYTKLKLGTSTVVNLIQVQSAYAFSQSALNNYLYSLNLALVQHRHQTGTLITADENGKLSIDLTTVFDLPPTTQ